jgi:hypothetical protein
VKEKPSVAIHRASTDTSVALIMAKTASPLLRFIRFTEPVVMIEVTGPAAVLMTISETTLSETICSIVPGKRLRMARAHDIVRFFKLSYGCGGRKGLQVESL